MKLPITVLISVLFLFGCGNTQFSGVSQESKNRTKPKIPQYELKASVLDYDYSKYEIDEMEKLLEEIDKDLERPNITEDDIRRGWYKGDYENRKYGTPDSWVWENNGTESKWISPNIYEEEDYFEDKTLCTSTAGSYSISCIDAETADCQYIPKTECKCIEGTLWVDAQGCILSDDNDEFILIEEDELKRGWYNGLPSQKKLNTPSTWIWSEGGQDSKWRNPGH